MEIMLKNAIKNMKGLSFNWTFDFEKGELEKLNDDQIYNHIMQKIRPDVSTIDRAEKECIRYIRDEYVNDIESIFIEKFVSEKTMKPRLKVNVVMKSY